METLIDTNASQEAALTRYAQSVRKSDDEETRDWHYALCIQAGLTPSQISSWTNLENSYY